MKPAFSIIFFTVSSGAGLGLLALIALVDALAAGGLPAHALWRGALLGLALVARGSRRRCCTWPIRSNAWRSFSRLRSRGCRARRCSPSRCLPVGARSTSCSSPTTAAAGPRVARAALTCAARLGGARLHGDDLRQPQADPAMAHALDSGQLLSARALVGRAAARARSPVPTRRARARCCFWRPSLGVRRAGGKLAYWHAIGAAARRADARARDRRGARACVDPAPVSVAQARLLDVGHSHGTFLTRRIRLRRWRGGTRRAARPRARPWLRACRCAWLSPGMAHWPLALGAGRLLYHRLAGRTLAFFRRSQAHGPAVPRRSSRDMGQGASRSAGAAFWRGMAADGRFQALRSVPRRDAQTVLDVVTYIQRRLDPTLAYRFACRVGMCGSCAMTVNGRPRWTCRTHVAQGRARRQARDRPARATCRSCAIW